MGYRAIQPRLHSILTKQRGPRVQSGTQNRSSEFCWETACSPITRQHKLAIISAAAILWLRSFFEAGNCSGTTIIQQLVDWLSLHACYLWQVEHFRMSLKSRAVDDDPKTSLFAKATPIETSRVAANEASIYSSLLKSEIVFVVRKHGRFRVSCRIALRRHV